MPRPFEVWVEHLLLPAFFRENLSAFADLQGPICYNDAQNKGISLIVH